MLLADKIKTDAYIKTEGKVLIIHVIEVDSPLNLYLSGSAKLKSRLTSETLSFGLGAPLSGEPGVFPLPLLRVSPLVKKRFRLRNKLSRVDTTLSCPRCFPRNSAGLWFIRPKFVVLLAVNLLKSCCEVELPELDPWSPQLLTRKPTL